jgi:hypothetical protein
MIFVGQGLRLYRGSGDEWLGRREGEFRDWPACVFVAA